MLVNADLHIHSKFSMATSKDMDIEGIAPRAREKGLQLVGSGDALHPKWLDIIEESTEYAGDGIYSHSDCDFILRIWKLQGNYQMHCQVKTNALTAGPRPLLTDASSMTL